MTGQAEHGVYNDETDSVDPVLLHHYYGASTPGNGDRDPDLDSDDSNNSNNSNNSDNSSNSNDSDDSNDSSDSNNSDDSDDSDDSNSSDDSNDSNHPVNPNNPNNTTNSNRDQEDERAQSWQDVAEIIAGAQKRNIRHDAAEVAKTAVPFKNEDEVQAFASAFNVALASSTYPAGFGLHEEYESLESYKTGRSLKPLVIPLPYEVWFPRIVAWCKAMDLLKRLQGTGVL